MDRKKRGHARLPLVAHFNFFFALYPKRKPDHGTCSLCHMIGSCIETEEPIPGYSRHFMPLCVVLILRPLFVSDQRTWFRIFTWLLSHAQKLAFFTWRRGIWIKLKNISIKQGMQEQFDAFMWWTICQNTKQGRTHKRASTKYFVNGYL